MRPAGVRQSAVAHPNPYQSLARAHLRLISFKAEKHRRHIHKLPRRD
jgi:hypothetical protein